VAAENTAAEDAVYAIEDAPGAVGRRVMQRAQNHIFRLFARGCEPPPPSLADAGRHVNKLCTIMNT
jgi:hypothetical protein